MMFYQPGISDGEFKLSPEESRHAIKVLRLTVGDVIEITDGKGTLYQSVLTDTNPSSCRFRVQREIAIPPDPYRVHIGLAPTKSPDRTEWFVEKCVELGVHKISFMSCFNSERASVNMDRIGKIAVSAMKQSQRVLLPDLAPMIPFRDVLKADEHEKFIAYVDASQPHHLKSLAHPSSTYLVLIGPEGDFTKDELEMALGAGFKKVSLGTHRLRTETAGVAACHLLNLINS
jgi:16S rRNA (uracil1498-N3)-methyltransferase